MRNLVRKALDLIRMLRKIRSLDLEDDLKRNIRKAYLRVILLKRYDSQNNVAKIAGHAVKFCTYETFSCLFNEIFLDQEYYFLTDSKNPFIVDCGSNIGMSVLYFKMIYPTSVILAFEPDREAFSCLETNVRVNQLQSVDTNRKALSKTEGNIDFYYDQDNPGSLTMSTIPERLPKQKQVVEAVRLSRYIDRDIDFLKIDVEGAERDVIEELNNEGKLSYIKQMVIEFHHHISRDSDVLSQILRLLEDRGFGYQIQAGLQRPLRGRQFQDILVYAYRKDDAAGRVPPDRGSAALHRR